MIYNIRVKQSKGVTNTMSKDLYILNLVYNYCKFGLSKARAYKLVKDRFINNKDVFIHRKHGFTHIDLYNSIVQKHSYCY